ncbi:hypothetical protein GCM10023232_19790 [Sphingosinicella ginsenosidimutans]
MSESVALSQRVSDVYAQRDLDSFDGIGHQHPKLLVENVEIDCLGEARTGPEILKNVRIAAAIGPDRSPRLPKRIPVILQAIIADAR